MRGAVIAAALAVSWIRPCSTRESKPPDVQVFAVPSAFERGERVACCIEEECFGCLPIDPRCFDVQQEGTTWRCCEGDAGLRCGR